jgi:hypothetical protein
MNGNYYEYTKKNKTSYDRALRLAKKLGEVHAVAPRTIRINGTKEKHWCVWVDVTRTLWGMTRVTRERKLFPRFNGLSPAGF